MRCVGFKVKLWGYYTDICQSYKCLDGSNGELAETCSRAFVSDITNLFTTMDGYFKYILKYNKVSVRGLNNKDIMEKCVELDCIRYDLAEKIIDFRAKWELTCDSFGRPPVHIAREFFESSDLELGHFLRSLQSIHYIKGNRRII